MKKTSKHYRQGDVLIERIALIPSTAVKQKRAKRVILAHGEVTGHHHSFATADVDRFAGDDGAEFFQVRGKALNFTLPLVREWKSQVMVKHPKLGLIEFARADVTVKDGAVVVDGAFALLVHQEHTVQAIPAGAYRGGTTSGRVRQCEYSPEALKNVQD